MSTAQLLFSSTWVQSGKPALLLKNIKEYLRQIVEIVISYGGIPILSTKADNVEGDHSINRATVEIAHEYDIPLWNFWAAADILPDHGLDAGRDNIYLTPDGWNRRNFTALQALDAVWRAVTAAARLGV